MSGLPVSAEVSVEEYLSFAKADLAQDGPQGTINALGNAKRGLHLMIDTMLQNYGLLANNLRLRFPEKLALLDEVGLVSLNVFRKLNVERNLAEHEYTLPSREQVEDFVDVCHLLRLVMERLGESIHCQVVGGMRNDGAHVLLALEPALGRLDVYALSDAQTHRTEVGGTSVEYVSTFLRHGERKPAAEVSGEPVRSYDLTFASRGEWSPLLRGLVGLDESVRMRRSSITNGVVQVWTGKQFEVGDMAGSSLKDMLGPDQALPILAAESPEKGTEHRPPRDDVATVQDGGGRTDVRRTRSVSEESRLGLGGGPRR